MELMYFNLIEVLKIFFRTLLLKLICSIVKFWKVNPGIIFSNINMLRFVQ